VEAAAALAIVVVVVVAVASVIVVAAVLREVAQEMAALPLSRVKKSPSRRPICYYDLLPMFHYAIFRHIMVYPFAIIRIPLYVVLFSIQRLLFVMRVYITYYH